VAAVLALAQVAQQLQDKVLLVVMAVQVLLAAAAVQVPWVQLGQ
jgi:hypothetical protein